MQACVLAVTLGASSPQTVTGVVDQTGANFVGKGFFTLRGHPANMLGYQTGGSPSTNAAGYRMDSGFDDLTNRFGEGIEDAWIQLGSLKGVDYGSSGGVNTNHSILDLQTQLLFGGFLATRAYINNVSAGQFDIVFDTNSRTGHTILVLVIGGSDVNIKAGYTGEVPGHADQLKPGFAAEAILTKRQSLPSSESNANGGPSHFLGWDTRTSGRGVTSSGVVDQGTNARYHTQDYSAQNMASDGSSVSAQIYVSNWSTTLTLNSTVTPTTAYLAIGGATVAARAGSLLQPSKVGFQDIETDIVIRTILFMSVGDPALGAAQVGTAMHSFGVADSARQVGYWTGEATVGNAGSILGARYISDADILLFGTPNGGSTTFTARAQAVGLSNSNRTFTIKWSAVDSTQRLVMWLALGETYTGPTPPTPPTPAEVGSRARLSTSRPRWLLYRFDAAVSPSETHE